MPLHIEASVNVYIRDCKEQQKRAAETPEYDSLIEKSLLLVVYLAGKYYRESSLSFSDLIQVGNIGLLAALHTYDSARSPSFSTYASFCIRREMFNWATSQRKKQEYVLSLEYLLRSDEDEEQETTLAEMIAREQDAFEERILTLHTLKKFLAYLSPIEKKVLMLRYGLNRERRSYSYDTMARILHHSVKTCKELEQRAMHTLRNIALRTAQDEAQP